MKCNACGTDNNNSAKYCANCGAILFPVCPHCGADISNADCFCLCCGEAIRDDKPQVTSEPVIPTPSSDKSRTISEPAPLNIPIKTTHHKKEYTKQDKKKIIMIVLFIIMFGLPMISTMFLGTCIDLIGVGFDLFFGM